MSGQRTHTNARTRKGPRKGMLAAAAEAGARGVQTRRASAHRNWRPVKTKKKVKKNIQTGIAHIQSTFNNTLVTITDVSGNVMAWSSAGVAWLQGLAQVHAVRRAARGRRRREQGAGARHAHGGGVREGPGLRARDGAARAAGRGIKVT